MTPAPPVAYIGVAVGVRMGVEVEADVEVASGVAVSVMVGVVSGVGVGWVRASWTILAVWPLVTSLLGWK